MQGSAQAPATWGLDGVGVFLSGLCLVHCAAPVFLPLWVSISTCHAASDRTHALLAVVLPAVALFAFQRGYAAHRSRTPAMCGSLGVALIILGALSGASPGETLETPLTVTGSLLLTGAHVANKRLLRRNGLRCCV